MDAHNAAVASVASRVKAFHHQQRPFRNYHGSSLSTRPSDRTRDNTVDTSALDHVLAVDAATQTALVEPNVPMDALVAATLRAGLLLPRVVMELPSITVGGGFSGSAGESSSFRYGLFEATVDEIEIVLPTGEVTMASKVEKRDLFWAAASAFGTLGVVTLLRVRLMQASKYVAVTYHFTRGFDATLDKIREESANESNDYLDAIMFSPRSAVTCAGRLVDHLPAGERPRHFTRRKDTWFYLRAKQVCRQLSKSSSSSSSSSLQEHAVTDYIPIVDYLFRYDRGAFWTGRQAYRYFKLPFNRITRYLLDYFMHTRVINTAQAKTDFGDYFLVQDCGVPLDKCVEFKHWVDDNIAIYPVWLCPLRVRRDSPDSCHGIHAGMGRADCPDLLNFGIWGLISWDRREVVAKNKALEAKVRELGGWKTLYAHAYYTEDEFWGIYDRDTYEAARTKYGASYLPSVYEKVRAKADAEAEGAAVPWTRSVWPVRGLRGVYHALKGGDVLLGK